VFPDAIEAHDYNHDGIADVVLLGLDEDNGRTCDVYEGSNYPIDIDLMMK